MARQKRYTLKQLYNLWVVWVDEYDINCQELFDKYNLDGSFINWLETRARQEGEVK